MSDEEREEEQSQEEIIDTIAEQLRDGTPQAEVAESLVQAGMDQTDAGQLVEKILFELKKAAEEEEFSGEVLLPALLGGLGAAVLGGVIWGVIVIYTSYEVGYVALAIGWLCGMGVVTMSQGKRGVPLQLVAVIASVLGILIGKYISMAQESVLSMEAVKFFIDNISSMASGYDILWIVLAVVIAWSIPKASRFTLANS